ncbi:hypothetical protein [Desertibacillus haloalkaliphilus]|uniref:hypothetical protein n=1 Tax=Desertibacillus haloalkaliphilus TaxID=1328930 RepID=UPI001C25FC1F|nr:hypothetical protein [Desertibacillus haloalkaliphilus]MBU8907699.1 hypothetical protein [Desertibacillus haloalkaliphilus]
MREIQVNMITCIDESCGFIFFVKDKHYLDIQSATCPVCQAKVEQVGQIRATVEKVEGELCDD